ncbi:PAS/PAC sensor protein [[Clostridium] sordellii]|uniref:HD domain-containing phosphohydrolase n=3 Tax=Paraclostridium sordellii TaxID=1505 RepID=UPI0005DE3AF4|nr:HD domain-containing phosphohydrolase [Paeniclostridium sordellii]MDU4413283.1 HD domain-containing protein [Paeniclostridium sordellii]CEO34505.1 PAS/PAC sensor protein [[Clostridium] sordellii] [Paeniclostridium sordellii]CEP93482.1 PAS/PAC sensor protein [[Clostridium] sordellii] [Paeniclostridium sordellii]CEQ05794.1 PAS/PAC sensor protein [[Clostridium] sordellii] [Paeniclostridium sordellii]
MKKNKFKLIACIFSIILIFIVVSIYFLNTESKYSSLNLTKEEQQWIKENKSRKITASPILNNNMYYYEIHGKASGVLEDLSKYINELYGINIETNNNNSSSDSDIIWSSENNNYNKEDYYITNPYDSIKLKLYTHGKIKSLKELEGRPIAIHKYFKDLVKIYKGKVNFVIIDNIQDIKRLYEDNDIYGFIGNSEIIKGLKLSHDQTLYQSNISNKFDIGLRVAVKKDKVLGSLINKALKSIPKKYMEQIKIKNQLNYLKYSLKFTDEEKDWLRKNQNIPIKINYKFEPYYYRDLKHKGILNDYINMLEYLLDVSFKDYMNIQNKKPMLYFGVSESDNNEKKLNLMNTYNKYNLYIYSSYEKIIDSINDLEGYKIGIVKNSDKKFIEDNLIDYECKQYKDYNEMTKALHEGEIDYFLGDNFIMANYNKKEDIYKDIYQVGFVKKVFYEHIGVNKEYKQLVSIMEKVDNAMSSYLFPKLNEISIEENKEIDYEPIIKIILALLGILVISSIYILKLKKEMRLKNDFHNNLHEALDKNERLVLSLVETLEDVNALNDSDTGNHIKRISKYCEAIAKAMNCSKEFINEIVFFSSLHDIGKVGIPDKILKKSGKLTKEEMEIMREHVSIGFDIIKKNDLGNVANNIILYHHERYDGRGYLKGLKGEKIPLEARIVAIADVYDALRMERCYKKGFSHKKSIDIILSEKGKHFDPKIVDIFIKINEDINHIYNIYK